MKQLQPKTILAIGLPCSLLFNLFVSVYCFYVFASSIENGLGVGVAIGVGAWLVSSVPVFVAMAVIRSRIGKFDLKRHQIKEAIACWKGAFVIALMTVAFAAFGSPLFSNFFGIGCVGFAVGFGFITGFGALVVLISGINVVIRLFAAKA